MRVFLSSNSSFISSYSNKTQFNDELVERNTLHKLINKSLTFVSFFSFLFFSPFNSIEIEKE